MVQPIVDQAARDAAARMLLRVIFGYSRPVALAPRKASALRPAA